MAHVTRWRGNSSRMMPQASGKTPPAAPWITRPTIMTGRVVERAEIVVPTASTTRMMNRSRPLPFWSPSRPTMGVAMATLIR